MDFDEIVSFLVLLSFAASLGWWIYSQRVAKRAKNWPTAEATIESSSMEVMARSRGVNVTLPVFAFSYRTGDEYYSGRFALLPYITDPGESILTRMIGRKFMVHYNPQKPSAWFIADKLIEGCQVEQKIGAHFMDFSPQ